MTYFPDLSPYTYTQSEPHTLNVGWLDPLHPFLTGPVSAIFLQRLQPFYTILIWNVYFGAHTCELCDHVTKTAEIRVFGIPPVVYAAPSMLMHYIVDHSYQPPEEFITAVLAGPTPLEEEYWVRANEYKWSKAPGIRPPSPSAFISWLHEKCGQAAVEASQGIVTDERGRFRSNGERVTKSAKLIGREATYYLQMYNNLAQQKVLQDIHSAHVQSKELSSDNTDPEASPWKCLRIAIEYITDHHQELNE